MRLDGFGLFVDDIAKMERCFYYMAGQILRR